MARPNSSSSGGGNGNGYGGGDGGANGRPGKSVNGYYNQTTHSRPPSRYSNEPYPPPEGHHNHRQSHGGPGFSSDTQHQHQQQQQNQSHDQPIWNLTPSIFGHPPGRTGITPLLNAQADQNGPGNSNNLSTTAAELGIGIGLNSGLTPLLMGGVSGNRTDAVPADDGNGSVGDSSHSPTNDPTTKSENHQSPGRRHSHKFEPNPFEFQFGVNSKPSAHQSSMAPAPIHDPPPAEMSARVRSVNRDVATADGPSVGSAPVLKKRSLPSESFSQDSVNKRPRMDDSSSPPSNEPIRPNLHSYDSSSGSSAKSDLGMITTPFGMTPTETGPSPVSTVPTPKANPSAGLIPSSGLPKVDENMKSSFPVGGNGDLIVMTMLGGQPQPMNGGGDGDASHRRNMSKDLAKRGSTNGTTGGLRRHSTLAGGPGDTPIIPPSLPPVQPPPQSQPGVPYAYTGPQLVQPPPQMYNTASGPPVSRPILRPGMPQPNPGATTAAGPQFGYQPAPQPLPSQTQPPPTAPHIPDAFGRSAPQAPLPPPGSHMEQLQRQSSSSRPPSPVNSGSGSTKGSSLQKPSAKAESSSRAPNQSARKNSKGNAVNPASADSGGSNNKKGKTPEKVKEDNNEEEKRKQFLERNRVAACKSRLKKKEWVNNLGKTAEDLSSKNAELQIMVGALREEIIQLRTRLAAHAGCNCPHIKEYLHMEQQRTASLAMHPAVAGAPMHYPQGYPPSAQDPASIHGMPSWQPGVAPLHIPSTLSDGTNSAFTTSPTLTDIPHLPGGDPLAGGPQPIGLRRGSMSSHRSRPTSIALPPQGLPARPLSAPPSTPSDLRLVGVSTRDSYFAPQRFSPSKVFNPFGFDANAMVDSNTNFTVTSAGLQPTSNPGAGPMQTMPVRT